MYEVDNQKIGVYLNNQITKSKYKNARQFGIAYLKAVNGGEEPSSEDIQKASNKISQIKNGNKGLQIEDLPIFADLLEISVDSLLSGGTAQSPSFSRVTNYSIAFSHDEEEWEDYIQRPDKLILNSDEYGKTVIDYALEFKNYDFLKYLMMNGFIWFVGDDPSKYVGSFGAGTSIERRTFSNYDLLDIKMRESDQLRTSLIALAIENRDYDILNELKAREIPDLYRANWFLFPQLDFVKYHNPEMMEQLSKCDEKVLDYFSEEFEIEAIKNRKCTFTFPYLGELIGLAMKEHSKAVPNMLRKALRHNENVLRKINEIANAVEDSYAGQREFIEESLINRQIKDEIAHNYNFDEKNGTVSFYFFLGKMFPEKTKGLMSNVISVTEDSKDENINSLIEAVNETYSKIAHYTYKEEQK